MCVCSRLSKVAKLARLARLAKLSNKPQNKRKFMAHRFRWSKGELRRAKESRMLRTATWSCDLGPQSNPRIRIREFEFPIPKVAPTQIAIIWRNYCNSLGSARLYSMIAFTLYCASLSVALNGSKLINFSQALRCSE